MRNLIIVIASLNLIVCDNVKRDNGSETNDSASVRKERDSSTLQITQSKKIKDAPSGRCDINTVVYTRDRLNTLTDSDIYEFLYTFDDECKNNSEFTALSNEVLFGVLLQYPKALSLHLGSDSINEQNILAEIGNPVVELQSMDDVFDAINILHIPDTAKLQLIKKLKDSM